MATSDVRPPLALQQVSSELNYDPDVGTLVWKDGQQNRVRRNKRRITGMTAGRKRKDGYIQFWLYGQPYLAHRVVWLLMTGAWPVLHIDHVNGVRDDNRWINIRQASGSENMCNARLRSNNTSGQKGVSWDRRTRSWSVLIQLNGVNRRVGRYKTFEEACAARATSAERLHGDFARNA